MIGRPSAYGPKSRRSQNPFSKEHNMKAQTQQIWKFILIIIASTVLTLLLHQVHNDPLMNLSTKPQSIVITSGWFPPVATMALAFTFCVMGVIFRRIQNRLEGTGFRKGGQFGLALGGMYLVGMIEGYVLFPVSFFSELYTGIADSCGIMLLSLLLGKYLANDSLQRDENRGAMFPAMVTIPVMYIMVRYFSYTVLHIESSYVTRPLATFLWTAGMGVWIGIMYRLVGRYLWPSHSLQHAAIFGGLVFGLNWLIFNLFTLLFIVVPLWDLLCRSVFDSFAIIIGVYISSRYQKYRPVSHNLSERRENTDRP